MRFNLEQAREQQKLTWQCGVLHVEFGLRPFGDAADFTVEDTLDARPVTHLLQTKNSTQFIQTYIKDTYRHLNRTMKKQCNTMPANSIYLGH